jgi:hypothetical protein
VTGAARDEAAHAVSEDRELVDRHRPRGDELLEEIGERATVGRDMEAAVVVEVDRREAEVVRQRRPVVEALSSPLPVVHARAMDQDEHLAGRTRNCRAQRLAFELEGMAVVAESRLDREWVLRLGQVVAEHALARAGRPEQRDYFGRLDRQVYAAQDVDLHPALFEAAG